MTGAAMQPELGGVVPYRLDYVSADPDVQVPFTVNLMRDYSLRSADTPALRADLAEATAGGNGDTIGAVHRFVRSRLRFRNDDETARSVGTPHAGDTVEVLVSPLDLSAALARGFSPAEDCDGFSMYVAALLETAGIPCAFVTVAADPEAPRDFSHVYVAAYPEPDIRVPVDASHGPYAGWECPNRYGRRAEWPLTESRGFPFVPLIVVAAAALLAIRQGGIQ